MAAIGRARFTDLYQITRSWSIIAVKSPPSTQLLQEWKNGEYSLTHVVVARERFELSHTCNSWKESDLNLFGYGDGQL
jgi:hypothetical protein